MRARTAFPPTGNGSSAIARVSSWNAEARLSCPLCRRGRHASADRSGALHLRGRRPLPRPRPRRPRASSGRRSAISVFGAGAGARRSGLVPLPLPGLLDPSPWARGGTGRYRSHLELPLSSLATLSRPFTPPPRRTC